MWSTTAFIHCDFSFSLTSLCLILSFLFTCKTATYWIHKRGALHHIHRFFPLRTTLFPQWTSGQFLHEWINDVSMKKKKGSSFKTLDLYMCQVLTNVLFVFILFSFISFSRMFNSKMTSSKKISAHIFLTLSILKENLRMTMALFQIKMS